MNQVSGTMTLPTKIEESLEFRRLMPLAGKSSRAQAASPGEVIPADPRIFSFDARFKSGGTWAGVDRLVELAYLGLLELGESAVVEGHATELYMVLLKYRDRIRPKYPCLTDVAAADERTRFYPLNRAYRLVHGLVGLVLRWRRALGGRGRWIIFVRNFEQAQHLGARFFSELARRSAVYEEIEVIIETPSGRLDDKLNLAGVRAVPAPYWTTVLRPNPVVHDDSDLATIKLLETHIASSTDALFEQNYPTLLAYYKSTGDRLAAARIAFRALTIYNSCGYYHEAKSFVHTVQPYLDQLVGNDEDRRVDYVSKINICLVMTGDPAGALRVVGELAAAYITNPYVVAHTDYILGIHYLRYAEVKDIERAERHILHAVDIMRGPGMEPHSSYDAFLRVFIDNGLAFVRARQGRHREALELCESGYEFLTNKLGEDRHRLHRSVLQYNIAQVYVMLGRLDEGFRHYGKAINMDPNYSEYHNEAGNLLQELGRYREAIEYYVRAIECSAPYPEVYFNKAVCHARLEEFEESLACFEFALELNPDQPEGNALRADVLRELGRFDEALEGYDMAIALGYEPPAVRVNRAVLNYNKGIYEQALEDMNYVIASDQHEASHYENRAAIYQAMHLQDFYLRDLETADLYRRAT